MNPSIGAQLREAREARSLTLEEVSKTTHMRLHYLQALEADDFESMPSSTQARGFLRTYANYLGLDAKAFLAALDRQSQPYLEEFNQQEHREATPRDDDSPTKKPDEVDPSENAPAQSVPSEAAPFEAAPKKVTSLEAPIPEKRKTQPGSQEAAFEDVGQRLKKQREILGLSLEDVERHTNLRRRYLEALESGNLEALPSPVQGRGMLNNYAVFLGMDPEPLLIRFAQGLQAGLKDRKQPEESASKKRRTPVLPARARRIFSGDVLIGGTVGVFLLIFVVWVSIRVFAMQSESVPTSTAPSIVDVLIASPTATNSDDADAGVSAGTPAENRTETPAQAAALLPVATETPTSVATGELPIDPNDAAGVEIYMSVHYRAWVRVTVDGEVELEGRVLPGSAYTFSAETQIEILTGNAGAIQVFYNQQDQERLGEYGEVVNLIFTPEGILAPTPTITPTATATPRVTPTTPLLPGLGTDLPPGP